MFSHRSNTDALVFVLSGTDFLFGSSLVGPVAQARDSAYVSAGEVMLVDRLILAVEKTAGHVRLLLTLFFQI